MPVLNRRRHVLAPRQGGSARNSTESSEGMKEQLWIVDEDYEKPQKEMDFSSAKLGKTPSKPTRHTLRINTYTKQELHDRYLSSEEEPSPSPEDSGRDDDDQLKQNLVDIFVDNTPDFSVEEFKAEVAVAMPILAFARPKLIDITNLAPMHKRKRPAKALLPLVAKNNVPIRAAAPAPISAPSTVDENRPHSVRENMGAITPAPSSRQQLKRKESLSVPAPDSWLPEDPLAEAEDEHYFPSLTGRPTASHRFNEYEPFLPSTPRSSTRSHHHFSTRVFDVGDSIHTPSSPIYHSPTASTSWKGLTRSLSLVKRHSGQPPLQQASKKPKMIPRGANEREDSPVIPPFPFEDGVSVAS